MTSDVWQELTLADLGRVVTGKTPLTANSENFGGKIPFVTPTDMDNRRVISTTERYLTQQGAVSVKNSCIPAGAVIVSCIGSQMGKAAIAGKDCVTNQQINSVVVDSKYSAQFIYYNLSSRMDEIRSLASGSAVPILSKAGFEKLPILLPPLAEQRAIARILGDALGADLGNWLFQRARSCGVWLMAVQPEAVAPRSYRCYCGEP